MKNLLLLIALTFLTFQLNAQTKIYKERSSSFTDVLYTIKEDKVYRGNSTKSTVGIQLALLMYFTPLVMEKCTKVIPEVLQIVYSPFKTIKCIMVIQQVSPMYWPLSITM